MEQKTEASQAVDEQAVSVEVYSNAVWLTKGMQTFRLAYTGESDVDRNWYAGQLRAALKAQPAPTEAARDRIPMPTNADQAELMQKLGLAWLQTNAPDRLTDAGRAAQGEDSARLSIPVSAYLWLMGAGGDAFAQPLGTGAFWWRNAFNKLAGVDMMDVIQQDRARASAETGGVKP